MLSTNTYIVKIIVVTLLLFCIILMFPIQIQASIQEKFPAPPNKPAKFNQDGSQLSLEYNQNIILRTQADFGENTDFNTRTFSDKERIDQVFKWTSRDRDPIRLTGTITASVESFPCEVERKHGSLAIVRHSIGLSRSLINRAVYDRRYDWVLSVDIPANVKITPETTTGSGNSFKIEIIGQEIILRFRPYYYNQHRGLNHFKPWSYQVWKEPIVGWSSWFAYFKDITEENIKHAADIISEVLVPFGFQYLQIDDGYQQEPAGLPETWIEPNDKFPSGLKDLTQYISQKGLKPSIWTYTSFHQREFAEANKKYFVLDENGEAAYGNWVGYIMDGSNPETIELIIRPLYRKLKQMGWQYFKVDALRHLRYEGYNSFSQYFKDKGVNLVKTYQHVVQIIREEIGEESFMLGCWGIRPELTGLIDGCRIGTDGFGYGGLAQYNSFNNVIWRNDPDHIELSPEEAFRSSTVTSLTGSIFLLTDKPEVYKSGLVEAAKRSVPVLFTLPGQIYDVDPTRSKYLYRVETELSGSGPRVFDADQAPVCHLFLLEINKPYENWMVLGRTGGPTKSVQFQDLGLSPENEYIVFEFWSKKFLGTFSDSFPMQKLDPKYNCQVYCIRQQKSHPQLIATNRHITCGGFELKDMEWKNTSLTGSSELVGGDKYILYIIEPDDYKFEDFICQDAKYLRTQKQDLIRTIEVLSENSVNINWQIKYSQN